ncbi:rhodanese-like domain-containing protein [Salinirubellus salinus]|uniref:Rhodanese-like domain-containing protein n=1 Tax=Salinirubellus salinus TaxID=1364945 RepID=A0A9E7R7N7_9EURY|nr:rhodanese-like domain-containing protein [Salinirubellus salinus]UWM56634.1 rhodanese-like domain-containing protein [Salinirubellus salinus]
MADFELEPDVRAWTMAERAEEHVEVLTVEDLRAELDERGDDEAFVVLDVRDIREVWIEGSIPDVHHAPRGMLEFWADPDTVYYKEYFHPERRYVLYCNEGGRSALAAKRLQEMGYGDVAHLDGGFTAWEAAGYETVDVEQRDYKSR